MNSNKIKAMLVERGIKQTEIAEDLGVTRALVNKVIHGTATSRRVKRYLIRLLGEESRQYWGDAA